MPEVIYSDKTERVWSRIPAEVRADDEPAGGFKLLASLIADRTDNISTLVRRFTYLPGADRDTDELRELLGVGAGQTADLVDPATADPGWLPWLAQIPGVTITPGMSTLARRDAISGAVSGWAAATRQSIADAASTALIGARYVQVLPHSIVDEGDGGRWDVLLVTRVSDTPDVAAVLAAVRAANAEPVGVLLHHRAYSATFAQTRAALPVDTLAARQALFPTFRDATDYLP